MDTLYYIYIANMQHSNTTQWAGSSYRTRLQKRFYYKFYYFSRFCYILWCYSIKVFPLVWHERVQQKMGTTTFIWQIVTWILGNSNVDLLFSSPPHCASSLPEWSCLSSLGFAGNHNCSGSWKNCVCPWWTSPVSGRWTITITKSRVGRV